MATVGFEQIERFLEESGATGHGSLQEQLEAWDVDYDAFIQFVGQWTEAAAARTAQLPLDQALQVGVVCGFEIGYRAAVEAESSRAPVSDEPLYVPEEDA